MKIPFDIKYRPQIESGEYKVETRDGRPARIICWDAKGEFPIISLVDFGNHEFVAKNTEKGYLRLNNSPDCCDLFIVTPEPELTEFEKRVYGMITNKFCVKEWSKTLLDLARKQIEAEKKSFKRLPTIKEWKWLIENCEWKWDNKRKGKIVTAKNGNSIFLSAAGYRDGMGFTCDSSCGYYWSSSTHMDFPDNAYCVYFNSGDVDWDGGDRCDRYYIYPVSDTPQEGFVDMGNNLFWAEKNVDGLYNYDEAMKLFERGSR